ncbi:MAG: nicotinate (nicotinamide) nucleotide adenylyltransferase [Gammaproteobacteria bacterium]|nr:nicotinate (nicotinamide) nucleotide adenylyltransferase [Gammaproteobacteria bacterium]MCY4278847.1 nicotinate (nicotinamide) nucleotide adenylyltransferase [Gammaproteobacteria bacterium]MCY4323831.1 nicotinate (nicotinamide) nucleotide adenylyltransferase [Gammaproteobacteria bacterium]
MRILYGGNFDPVHVGHAALVRYLLRRGGQVCMLASVNPPFRRAPVVDVSARKAMLSLAFTGETDVCVASVKDYCESPYTIDLLRKVRGIIGASAPLAWAMGSDQYAKLNTWRDWTDLTNFAHLLVFRRSGDTNKVHRDVKWRWPANPATIGDLDTSPAGQVAECSPALPCVSSTDIRDRLSAGDAVEDLVPSPVLEYITEHRLYQTVS